MKNHVLTLIIIIIAIPSIFVMTLCCVGKIPLKGLLEKKLASGEIVNVDCHFWKCGGGKLKKDVLVFNPMSDNKVVNDTLYVKGRPEAVIVKLAKGYVSKDYILTIRWLSDGAESYYVAK